MHSIANLRSIPLSLSIVRSSSSPSSSPNEKSEPKQVKLRDDWRQRSRPIPPGGTYPAKEHCSRCGLCDTYYIAHVKDACAFLGNGMSRIEELEPVVHGRGRKTDVLDETYFGVHEKLLYARKIKPVEGAQWTGIVTTIAIEMLKSGMVEAVICVQSDPEDRFSPRPILARYAKLMSLQQEGTVKEYRRLFEKYAKGMRDISSSALEGKWESGLKEEIRSEMRKLQPVGIQEKKRMTQVIEDDFAFHAAKNGEGTSTTLRAKAGATVSGMGGADTSSHRTTPVTPVPFKKLTETEIRARKDKGLCFRCDAKFVPGHRCQTKELQALDVWVVPDTYDYSVEGNEEDIRDVTP